MKDRPPTWLEEISMSEFGKGNHTPSWEVSTLKAIVAVHAIVVVMVILGWELWTLFQHLFR